MDFQSTIAKPMGFKPMEVVQFPVVAGVSFDSAGRFTVGGRGVASGIVERWSAGRAGAAGTVRKSMSAGVSTTGGGTSSSFLLSNFAVIDGASSLSKVTGKPLVK